MGRSESSQYVMGIFIYFVLLFSIFYLVENFNSEYGTTTNNLTSSGGGIPFDTPTQYCGEERFNGEVPNFKKASLTPTELINFEHINDQQSCEYFQGFSWQSSFNIFTWSTTETCKGTLNYTYYDGGSTNYTTDWGGLYLQDSSGPKVPLSNLELVYNDRKLCENLGFDWINTNDTLTVGANSGNVISMWGIISKSLTFNLSFSTSQPLINLLLNLFFIGAPLMIMAFHIFIMLPFVGGD